MMYIHFGSREDYLLEREKVSRLGTDRLEKLLGELYEKRYVEQDINYESYYRLVSSVYVHRTRDNRALKFHLQNFLG
jgi:hypothetical protein